MCAEGGVIAQQLARRIVEDGGAALIADYGHDGTGTDTFRVGRGAARFILRGCKRAEEDVVVSVKSSHVVVEGNRCRKR